MEFICFINILYRYGKKVLETGLDGFTMQELIVILVVDQAEGYIKAGLSTLLAWTRGTSLNF